MRPAWGHFPDDGRRHVIRPTARQGVVRRHCRGTDLHAVTDLPIGCSYSDLPACRTCSLPPGRRLAGPAPPPRVGWVASHPEAGGNQTLLPAAT